MEDIKLKKYTKPEIEIEYLSPSEDIMAVSLNVSAEDDKLLGIIDVENLVGAVKNIPNIFK